LAEQEVRAVDDNGEKTMSANDDSGKRDVNGLRILVPLDGSKRSAKGAEFAGRLPASEIVLLHVAGSHEADSRAIEVKLEQVAGPLGREDRSVEVVARTGDVAGAILDAVTGCDLIAMATHGRGAAGRFLFGSVADRISRHSTTPTLLVRPGDDKSEIPPTARIVVPLDGSELAERALPIASTIAIGMSLPVHLLRAVGLDEIRSTIREQKKSGKVVGGEDQTYDDARKETERRAGEYLATVAQRLRALGQDVQTEVLEGTAAFALLWKIQPGDLVAMTSHGRNGFRRWLLGSVAEKLVREAKGPVLLVPTRERQA